MEEGREAGRSLMEREKSIQPKTDPCRTPQQTPKATFVNLINHASMPIRKERLNPSSKARRKASQNEFVEKNRMPDRVKSFREINSSRDCLRAQPGLAKLIQN